MPKLDHKRLLNGFAGYEEIVKNSTGGRSRPSTVKQSSWILHPYIRVNVPFFHKCLQLKLNEPAY